MPGKNVVDLGVEADLDDIPEITDCRFARARGGLLLPPASCSVPSIHDGHRSASTST
jgi:hypothetical protein